MLAIVNGAVIKIHVQIGTVFYSLAFIPRSGTSVPCSKFTFRLRELQYLFYHVIHVV